MNAAVVSKVSGFVPFLLNVIHSLLLHDMHIINMFNFNIPQQLSWKNVFFLFVFLLSCISCLAMVNDLEYTFKHHYYELS